METYPLLNMAETEIIGPPSPAILAEHGLIDGVAIWQQWAGENEMPRWKDVDLLALPGELRGGTMVADYLPDADDYRVRYWGVRLVEAFQIELTGKMLSTVFDRGVMSSFRSTAHEVIVSRKPQFLMHAITSEKGVRRHFPVVRLPISDGGNTVTKIMTIENVDACLRAFAMAG